MKKLILIFLLLLLPSTVQTAENQSIIFSGSYSINNEATDADSAWLYMFNNATLVDSTKVTAEDLQWDGCYQYAHTCTNDSTDGWTGWWVYFGESETVSVGEWAIIATARDSSYALESSLTALRDSAQYMVTSDGDTNQFTVEDIGDTVRVIINDSIPGLMDSLQLKARHAQVDSLKDTIEDMSTRLLATGFSTHSQVDSLKDTVEDMSTRLLATGFSTFDYTTDKVTLVDTSADGIHDAEIAALDGLDSANVIHQKLFFQGLSDSSSGGSSPWSEAEVDSMLNAVADANKENFKATGFSTASQVDSLKDTTEDMSTRLLATGFSTLTDNDIRDAIGDSLYNERIDSLLTVLVEVKGYSLDLAYYWGACDGCYYRLFPEGGLADKDSAIIIDPAQGADSLVAKVVYKHGTDVEIVDTVYFYRDEPW